MQKAVFNFKLVTTYRCTVGKLHKLSVQGMPEKVFKMTQGDPCVRA